MRITFVNQKGGVGKSTVALLLAAVLNRVGYDVVIHDQDAQGTARYFAARFGVRLFEAHPNAACVVTDTGGHMGDLAAMAGTVVEADKIILVAEKGPAAVHASLPMARFIAAHISPSARAYVLFNKVRSSTTVGRQSGAGIAADLGLAALQNEIALASAYEAAFVTGFGAVTGDHRTRLLAVALEIMQPPINHQTDNQTIKQSNNE